MKNKNQYLERASYSWSEDSVRLMATPSSTARAIFFYIQEAGYFKTKSPYFTERANLDSFLIVYTISGKGLLRYENQEYVLHAGQCFFINCINHHYYEAYSNSTWEFLWIHFNGGNALGYYEEFVKNGFRIVTLSEPDCMEGNLRKIISIHSKFTITTEISTSNHISAILSELLIQTATKEASLLFVPDSVKLVKKYIDRNFHTKIVLEDLEKELGMSKFHISKEFKKYTGTTVGEYILSNRLSSAKELLKYSDLPISEISFRIGINNVSHFINLFKSREKVTPLAFRKEWRTL
ncbi:helix-turn-helix domain-containing protein [Konateibacter massiliensis]|uniref:helix-turn-helix domain-containing protein n=1 Tax=Konateibacter massiliensis TaxID=2002841 RepID=UPI000C159539|nr:AraC family transcriptional regulator [Konateibacter massiliensis]